MTSQTTPFSDIQKGMDRVRKVIETVTTDLGSFDILDSALVPEGLKPIARSISWLVEQIVIQNVRRRASDFDIEYVKDPPHNLTQYDCIIKFEDDPKDYYVNMKTSLKRTKKSGRFDVSKAEKLITLYEENDDFILLVAVVNVIIDSINVEFSDIILFNVAWVPSIYYNRANHNLQSSADGSQEMRTNEEFVEALREKMREAGHETHY